MMGNFKEKNREGIREMHENSKKTTELGTEMTEQADEINAVLESIELQDEEDVAAISETGRSYQSSFDSAFSEQVETAGEEIERQGEQVEDAVGEELESVRSGIGKLEHAEGISDIGRDAAKTGRSELEGSAREYEDIASDAEEVVSETAQQIEALKKNLGSIFG